MNIDTEAIASLGPPCDRPGCADVGAWRFDRLVAAGFDRGAAAVIAATQSFDLHALLELVDRGCPPALAARILAPLDDGGSRQ
jgi:hypothetical protein